VNAFERIKAGVLDALAWVRGEAPAKVTTWTVDRDGRVNKNERMVVLKAKSARN